MTVESESDEPANARRELAYLNGRVREEAAAAAGANSIEATLIHISLATAYARRVQTVRSADASIEPD